MWGPVAEVVGRVIIAWHAEELGQICGELSVTTECALERGWHVLAVLRRCPNRCEGGEVLQGSDLVACLVCEGIGSVPVGVGGFSITRSARADYEIDGEKFEEHVSFFDASSLVLHGGPQ